MSSDYPKHSSSSTGDTAPGGTAVAAGAALSGAVTDGASSQRTRWTPTYGMMRLTGLVISSFSPQTLTRVARLLTFLIFDLIRLRRGLIMRNLRTAFGQEKPEKELTRIGRESVFNFILTGFEFFHGHRHDIAGDVELIDQQYVRAALKKGKGVYILCMHMGNWEVMGAACTRLLAPSYVLVKKVGSDSVDRYVTEQRHKQGFLTIARTRKGAGVSGIRKALAAGGIVGFVMDQARPGEPRLPFFGKPAKTNTSFAYLWRRDRSPIVPAYINRTTFGQHKLRFFPELELTVTENSEADVLAHSTYFNQVVESCIRQAPEQYFWLHNRWK